MPLQVMYISAPNSKGDMKLVTSTGLAELLRETKRAHTVFESETNKTDTDWPGWYARYIIAALTEEK